MLKKLIIKFSWVSQPFPNILWSQAASQRTYNNIFQKGVLKKWLRVPNTILKSNLTPKEWDFRGDLDSWAFNGQLGKRSFYLADSLKELTCQILLILMEMHYLLASDNLTEYSASSSLVQNTFAMWFKNAFLNCLQIFLARQRAEIFSPSDSYCDGDLVVHFLGKVSWIAWIFNKGRWVWNNTFQNWS